MLIIDFSEALHRGLQRRSRMSSWTRERRGNRAATAVCSNVCHGQTSLFDHALRRVRSYVEQSNAKSRVGLIGALLLDGMPIRLVGYDEGVACRSHVIFDVIAGLQISFARAIVPATAR